MEQKPERIRTLGCGGLIRLAMELDKNDYPKEPKVVLDATDGTEDAQKKEQHVRVSLAESACRKLASMLLDFADKLAAARTGKAVGDKSSSDKEIVETLEVEKAPSADK